MTRSHTHTDERGDSHGKESSQGREEEGRRKEAVTPETRSPWGAKVCAPVFCTPLLHAVPHAHTPHHVALAQLLDHFHAPDHLAEDGVPSLEMRLRTIRDEVLAAAGLLSVERHAHRAAQVRPLVELVAERVARPAFAVAARIAVLQHEPGHDAMNAEPIEKAFAREG